MKLLKALPRAILLLLVLAVFFLFLYPATYGLLDLSNALVMLACLLAAAALLFPKQTRRLFSGLWSKRWGKVLLSVAGTAAASICVLLAVLMILVGTKMRQQPSKPCRTVIVLGCMVRGERPSLQLRYRIEAAADYLDAHPEAVAILSGGQGRGERITEADCMFRELTARGIDPDRLYREDRSSTTRENLIYSMDLIRRENLAGPVAIVSNDFHIYRALRMAEDLGLPAEGLAARSRRLALPFSVFREAMAMVKYWLTA